MSTGKYQLTSGDTRISFKHSVGWVEVEETPMPKTSSIRSVTDVSCFKGFFHVFMFYVRTGTANRALFIDVNSATRWQTDRQTYGETTLLGCVVVVAWELVECS